MSVRLRDDEELSRLHQARPVASSFTCRGVNLRRAILEVSAPPSLDHQGESPILARDGLSAYDQSGDRPLRTGWYIGRQRNEVVIIIIAAAAMTPVANGRLDASRATLLALVAVRFA